MIWITAVFFVDKYLKWLGFSAVAWKVPQSKNTVFEDKEQPQNTSSVSFQLDIQ